MTNETATTIKLPKETLKKIKLLALEKGTTQKRITNDLLNQALNKPENEIAGLPKAEVINHKMLGYDPKYKGSLENIIGIVEVNNPEKIDVQELKDSIHMKKGLY